MSEENYQLTAPSGKVWTLRPLPKHFFIYFGQLPNVMSERVMAAVKTGDAAAVEKEIESTLSPDEMLQTLAFVRDAIQYACVNPVISLNPKNENEISPFQITPDDFDFLSKAVMQGGGAAALAKFPRQPVENAANRNDRQSVRATPKRTARQRS